MRLNPQTYAITINALQSRRLFQKPDNAELFLNTLFHYRTQNRFLLHAFVVMPDHIHVLITPTESTARSIQFIKGGFSHAIRDSHQGEVWHTGHYEHRIRDAADYEAQRTYIARNPERKSLQNYPYVHTNYLTHLDPPPPNLHQ